ncbi:hypothetical protein EYR36_004956 [Pleurotus pulmonarius]|nr:hypothetical protein EYR36_004956 [Pleurotus pulmonarius]
MGYCSPGDNFRNALVSKAWSDNALNVLWHRVDSLRPLVKILAPLQLSLRPAFTRPIIPIDWAGFRKYSWRVHEIKAHDWLQYDGSIFVDMAFSRPSYDLFPHLRSVDFEGGSAKYIALISHTTITTLHIRVAATNHVDMLAFRGMLMYLPDRTPKLEHLDLALAATPHAHTNISSELHIVLGNLFRLKTLHISVSLFDANSRTLHSLSRLPRLESLSVFQLNSELQEDATPYPAPSSGTGFSSLTSLRLTHSLTYATSLLEGYEFIQLRSFTISSGTQETIQSLVNILEAVAVNCLKLACLVVQSAGFEEMQPQGSTLAVLQSLARCLSLTELQLQDFPLNLDTNFVSSIMTALPALRTLVLRPDPAAVGPPTLPISALSEFTSICPQMTNLSLYMDTTLVDTPITGGNKPFLRLEDLDVGDSPANSSAGELAAFLSGVLPEGCRLSWRGFPPRWASVADLLPTLIRIRKAEQAMINCQAKHTDIL